MTRSLSDHVKLIKEGEMDYVDIHKLKVLRKKHHKTGSLSQRQSTDILPSRHEIHNMSNSKPLDEFGNEIEESIVEKAQRIRTNHINQDIAQQLGTY